MNWKGLVPMAKAALSRNANPLLMVAGTVGFATTVAMTAKVSPKAKEHLSCIRNSEPDYDPKEHVWDEVRLLAPYYGPVVGVGSISLGCFYGANFVQGRKNAMLAAAASVSERALISYQDKVIERFGEEEHGKLLEGIADDILNEKTEQRPVLEESEEGLVRTEGDGEVLCYDRVTGRYFHSSPERIRAAENVVVKRCMDELTVSVNDFYEELGLSDTSVIGETIGWDATKVRPDIHFSAALDEDGRVPMLVLNYHTCVIRRGMLESTY